MKGRMEATAEYLFTVASDSKIHLKQSVHMEISRVKKVCHRGKTRKSKISTTL